MPRRKKVIAIKEEFTIDPNAAELMDDEDLLRIDPIEAFTELKMFMCVGEPKSDIKGLRIGVEELTNIIKTNLNHVVFEVHSNYGHGALQLYPIKKQKSLVPKETTRKTQGDNTCFGSAVEIYVHIDIASIPDTKFYKVKYFSTTGELQVPGCIIEGFKDIYRATELLVEYLNGLREKGLFTTEQCTGPITLYSTLTVDEYKIHLINYNFRLQRTCNRMFVNIPSLYDYIQLLHEKQYYIGCSVSSDETFSEFKENGYKKIILPPFKIVVISLSSEDNKLIMVFDTGIVSLKKLKSKDITIKTPKMIIFPSGKINILGGITRSIAENLYAFITQVIIHNLENFIFLTPRPD